MSDDFLTLDYGKVAKNITGFISSQVKLRKKNGIVIGLSGGIDSLFASYWHAERSQAKV